MKSTFAAAILSLIIAGCKAGPASTTDPFFGNTRVAPPPTGSAQAIPPGSGYYQSAPSGVPSGTPTTSAGSTLPPPPGTPAQPGQYIPLNGGQAGSAPASGNPAASTTVYPPATVPPGYSAPASGPYQNTGPYGVPRTPSNSSSLDPFPNTGASLSPVRRGTDPGTGSSPSIEQTTALGNRGSRVVVPEKALNWQETPRAEQSTFGTEMEPSPRVGGSLPTSGLPSGSPIATRQPTAAEASSRPLADRRRITSAVGPGGRPIKGAAYNDPSSTTQATGSTAGQATGSTVAPGYLPQTEPSIDIMALPPARKQSDPHVRPTSATAPLSQDREGRESGGIYFRTGGASSNAQSGNAPRHTTTTRRITTGHTTTRHTTTRHTTTRHTTTRHLEQPARSVFRGTLDYSEPHRRWYVDLDPAPTGGSTESGNTEDGNAKGGRRDQRRGHPPRRRPAPLRPETGRLYRVGRADRKTGVPGKRPSHRKDPRHSEFPQPVGGG